MAKLIALKSGFDTALFHIWRSDYFSHLKQQTLLFDQIGILQLDEIYQFVSTLKSYPDSTSKFSDVLRSELEYLEQNGIIFNLTLSQELSAEAANSFFTSHSRESDAEVSELLTKIMKRQKIETKSFEDLSNRLDSLKERDALILRLLSLVMEKTRKASVVTTLPYTEYLSNIPNSNKSDVAQIIMDKLPLPNDETPWEQIIDYRNDTETQSQLLSLRRWISKISSQNLPPAEIEEEFESLTNDFQKHMNFHKMKANTETLEVMVKAPLEIIENLVKLKFSKIPEPLFALKKRQINLMEAELNAPGREVAYMIKTQETFQSHE